MINLELYRIFKIVADEENLTKASNVLHISQPAVTKHIKNLENELNIELFKRSKHGMILTRNGKKLYMHIKDSITILSKADCIFNTNKDIKLGVHVNMPSKIYSEGISKFYETNNNIINIHKLTATNIFSMLEKQEIDIAFSKKYSDELYDTSKIKFIKIGELHDVFVVNSSSEYLGKKLSKSDLRDITIYTLKKFSSAYQNLIKVLGYKKDDKTNIENVDYTGIVELLRSRDVVAVITKEYIEDKLENNELCLLDTKIKLEPTEYGIYYNIKSTSKEVKKLIEIFQSNS